MGILSLLCFLVFFVRFRFYFVFFCTVSDFSAAEKARDVKFCMRVGLLSGQVFSPFVSFGSRGVTGALLPRRMAPPDPMRRSMAWAFGIGGGGVA